MFSADAYLKRRGSPTPTAWDPPLESDKLEQRKKARKIAALLTGGLQRQATTKYTCKSTKKTRKPTVKPTVNNKTKTPRKKSATKKKTAGTKKYGGGRK